jgi:hypothetical protein
MLNKTCEGVTELMCTSPNDLQSDGKSRTRFLVCTMLESLIELLRCTEADSGKKQT